MRFTTRLRHLGASIGGRLRSTKGFTLIELLVVILIIGILAAIAIPSFLNQKGKGQDASTKSAVRNAQTAMETYATGSSSGDYNGASALALRSIEGSLPATGFSVGASQGAGTANVSGSATSGYRIAVTANGRQFWIDKDSSGNVLRGCSPQGQGGCATGTW